ncbi:uncharacterized protein LOC132048849 isoform X2 [Lycium ferocissimum]|uniref:uncharacterized protein LOC132048849 isoform X2 n=1 Tax=Lycium ferocissimum TaxID=112874 RepID=UPI002815CE1A|nr:uncharacterized protein LOC132048849 isoform X2 [Lycium ferocissimum]
MYCTAATFELMECQLISNFSNGIDKLCVNGNDSTSLFSTPCLIQDEKPKLDVKRDTLNAIASDHPKEEENSPSLDKLPAHKEELELSETKISLLADPDQELDEVSELRIEAIQGNERTEVLAHNEREVLFEKKHNDEGESNELQHTGMIETDNLDKGLVQGQEKQVPGDQETINHPDDGYLKETSTCNEHEPLNSAFEQGDQTIKTIELMKAADEDKDKDHMQSMYFEEQCVDAETQTHQFAKKCDLQMQLSDEEECAKEHDQANSCYKVAASENSHCTTRSMDTQNLAASEIRNASIDDELPAEVIQVIKETNAMEPSAGGEQSLETEQLVEKQSFELHFQGNDSKDNEVKESVFVNEEAGGEEDDHDNDIEKDDAAEEVIRVMKEINATDPAASGEQSPEAEHSPIQLVEKQSFEQNCQQNVLKEDNEASKRLSMDIEVVEKDLEAHSKEVKDEVEENVSVYEEKEEDDDHDNGLDKDDAEQEVEDDILEGARNSSEQSNSNKLWAGDSNQGLLLELKDEKVKEEEEGTKIEDEPCSVEDCNLKSTQNDVATRSCQQSYDGKDDSAANFIGRYQMKLMYLDDVAAITRRRRVLVGALLVLIWYVLKCILPSGIRGFKILDQ